MTQKEQTCFRVALFRACIRGGGATLLVMLAVIHLSELMVPVFADLFPSYGHVIGEIVLRAANDWNFVVRITGLAFLVGFIDELDSAHTKLRMERGEISKPPHLVIQSMNAATLLVPIFWLGSFGITFVAAFLFLASAYHFLIILLAMFFMGRTVHYLFPN